MVRISRRPVPAEQQTPFFPPHAMQQSMWDSVVNGEFIDAKIFAFSRRSREPGRVDTPKALFVNTHVLAAACSYFQSTFSSSDGTQTLTSMNDALPPGVEPFFDLEEQDSDSDFDDPIQEDPAEPSLPTSPDISKPPQRTIKTYVVKYTAYKTLFAIVWYIYTGEIAFSDGSLGGPNASAKSVYRFADEHRMDDLKALASKGISSSINKLSPSELVEEACSVFTSQHLELLRAFVERLPSALSRDSGAKLAFQKKISAYFCGRLPHYKEVVTSMLLCLLDETSVHAIRNEPAGDHSAILRVPHSWPGRTKAALRVSLDIGIFDDFMVAPGFITPTEIYFAAAVLDSGVFSSPVRASARDLLETDLRPSTWQAIAYYMYTGCITFKPLGSENIEPPAGRSPSDTQFRGYPCSIGEMRVLANELGCTEIVNLLGEMSPGVEVLKEAFSGSPPIPEVIEQGVKTICSQGIRGNQHIQSQLREILEEAASGSRLNDLVAFSACFSKLL